MKNLIITFSLLTVVLVFSACYKESYWLDDNAVSTGKFYPNVFFNNLDSATYSKGSAVKCYIEYWSKDKIKEIRFHDSVNTVARKVVKAIPYAPAYSSFKKSDTLVYFYTVPLDAPSGATIRLDAVVENDNGLTRLSNRLSFRVK